MVEDTLVSGSFRERKERRNFDDLRALCFPNFYGASPLLVADGDGGLLLTTLSGAQRLVGLADTDSSQDYFICLMYVRTKKGGGGRQIWFKEQGHSGKEEVKSVVCFGRFVACDSRHLV